MSQGLRGSCVRTHFEVQGGKIYQLLLWGKEKLLSRI